jgi:EAL domain-containing protein (putative c-di-GMP-specific phosphodiesterase class I)
MGQLLGAIHITDDWSAEQIACVRRKRLDRVSGFAETIATRDNTATMSATAQISWETPAMSNHAPDPIPGTNLMDDEAQLYSLTLAAALNSLSEALQHHAGDIENRFFDGLTRLSGSTQILKTLSEPELQHLRSQQLQHLYALAAPDLTAKDHRAMALRTGRIHATVGLNREDLIRSWEILSAEILETVDTAVHSEALSVLGRRLTRDLAWQTEAYQRLQASRQDVLLRITRLAWKTDSYTDLIGSVVQILGKHDEVAGCSVGRPDSQGVFRFESVSGRTIETYLTTLERSAERQIMTGDRSQGQGPAGRAWCSDEVERSVNIATDPRMAPWRDFALQAGFRSCVAVPLCQPGQPRKAILTLYSAFPGGFTTADRIAFIALLQTILGFALARIERLEGSTGTVPYAVRQHWSLLLKSDALQMHYQPLMDLKTGQITKIEALARLRDGNRLLKPEEFFPALSSDDFLELYTRGLMQALSQRSRWLRDGIDLNVSVNLPPSALSDNRYFEATQQALTECGCAPDGLTLEILETDAFPTGVDVLRELTKFKTLGVKLAEDDLGSGHSSLNRLRELPFDLVKIDRKISNLAGHDASDALRFIHQLIRLGHSLGKTVVVEGIEDTGMLEAVAILGADVAQGYAIAHPMPGEQVAKWLGSQPGLSDCHHPDTPPGKLARRLLWEERLHLISEDPLAFAMLADISKTSPDAGAGPAG